MLFSHSLFMKEAFGSESAAGISHGGGRVGGVGKGKKSGTGGDQAAKGKGKIGPPVDKKWAERWRVQLKIAGVRTRRGLQDIVSCAEC